VAPAGLIFGIKDNYLKAEDPKGSTNQYAQGRTVKRWQNDLNTKVGYGITKDMRALLFYNYYKQDYKDAADFTQDYNEHEVGIGGEMKIMPKTWGFLRYHYGLRDYNTYRLTTTSQNDSDFKWSRVNAGLTWDPDAKITGELNIGYQWKKYDNKLTPAGTARDEKHNTWIAATNLNYQATDTTLLTANVSRALRETGADSNEAFSDTALGIAVEQTFLTKFVAKAGFTYSRNKYYNIDRKDNNYLCNVGVDYNIQKWLTAGVSYNYNKKDSNQVANEFTDNQFMAKVELAY
jgi:hypothetical protein